MKTFLSIAARTPEETERFGHFIGGLLQKGDCLALTGVLGVGKTTLARALIRAALEDEALEVPSPTYTIAHWYDAGMPILHADLYRLKDPDEWLELGVEDVLTTGAALIEWPDRAGSFLPRQRLDIIGKIAPDQTRIWCLKGPKDWVRRAVQEEVT